MNAPSGLPGSQSLKILRIKRKRDEEPPELLGASQRKGVEMLSAMLTLICILSRRTVEAGLKEKEIWN